jgi:hypothetical protein
MTRRTLTSLSATCALAGVVAWVLGNGRTRPASASAPVHEVVDSVVPMEVSLAAFRKGLTPTDSLAGGAASREDLVHGFIVALERRDTASLRRLVLSKAEFAYLFYPTNPQALPPYDLSPALYWFLTETRSRQGLAHALSERAGTPLHYKGSRCLGTASIEGENKVYGPCVVTRLQEHGDSIVERLFGSIIERRGRWKFVSYANKLD